MGSNDSTRERSMQHDDALLKEINSYIQLEIGKLYFGSTTDKASEEGAIDDNVHPIQDMFNIDTMKAELRKFIAEEVDKLQLNRKESDDMNQDMQGLKKALQDFIESTMDKDSLPDDTYTLMMKSEPCSLAWFIGFAVWVIQISLAKAIFDHQRKMGEDSSPFDIPIRFDSQVRVGQFLCIFLAMATINDIYESTNAISRTYKKNETDSDIKHAYFPNLLKLSASFFVAIITLVLIISTNDLINLLTQFAGLTFISEIDDHVYEMATKNCFGAKVKYLVSPTEGNGGNIQVFITIIFLLTAFGVLTYFVWTENDYFYKKYPKCLIPPSRIKDFGNGKCDSGLLNTIYCEYDGGDCINFNREFLGCKATYPFLVGNGVCDNSSDAFTPECDFDAVDCCEKSNLLKNKTVTEKGPFLKEDCNPAFNTVRCLDDYGFCSEFNLQFGKCDIEKIANDLLSKKDVNRPGLSLYSQTDGCQEVVDSNSGNITDCVYKAKYPNCTSNVDESSANFFCSLTPDNECVEIKFPVEGASFPVAIVIAIAVSSILLIVIVTIAIIRRRRRRDKIPIEDASTRDEATRDEATRDEATRDEEENEEILGNDN